MSTRGKKEFWTEKQDRIYRNKFCVLLTGSLTITFFNGGTYMRLEYGNHMIRHCFGSAERNMTVQRLAFVAAYGTDHCKKRVPKPES